MKILRTYLPFTFSADTILSPTRFLYVTESSIYYSAIELDFHPPCLFSVSMVAPVLATTVADVRRNACPFKVKIVYINKTQLILICRCVQTAKKLPVYFSGSSSPK